MTRKKIKSIVSFAIRISGFLVLLNVDYRIAIGVLLVIVAYALDESK